MSMRVLIVDDEPLARDELAYLLGKCEGVSAITQADSIEEALGTMLEDPVDLIFLDIHLTNESGLSLAAKINKLKKPPMIIFATAYDDYAVKAFEMGIMDIPFAPSKFNMGKMMPARDNSGAIRYLMFGNVPFTDEIKDINRAKLDERAAFEKRNIGFQMTVDDIYAVGRGRLIGRPEAKKEGNYKPE